jgi:hypothetical protein
MCGELKEPILAGGIVFTHVSSIFSLRYLTGSVLFLSLVLGRFHSMILELVKNEENIEVMKKQMAQSSKGNEGLAQQPGLPPLFSFLTTNIYIF